MYICFYIDNGFCIDILLVPSKSFYQTVIFVTLVTEIQGQEKVREFQNLSWEFGILLKVREIEEKSEKFKEIYIS